MNHERAELIDAIRATARSMRECSGKMLEYGLKIESPDITEKSVDVLRSSLCVNLYADLIEIGVQQ
jgi:hypothetical protein